MQISNLLGGWYFVDFNFLIVILKKTNFPQNLNIHGGIKSVKYCKIRICEITEQNSCNKEMKHIIKTYERLPHNPLGVRHR